LQWVHEPRSGLHHAVSVPEQLPQIPVLPTSVSLIERVAIKESAIIDIGGGESTLVDDLS
jgi:hypothetical protein